MDGRDKRCLCPERLKANDEEQDPGLAILHRGWLVVDPVSAMVCVLREGWRRALSGRSSSRGLEERAIDSSKQGEADDEREAEEGKRGRQRWGAMWGRTESCSHSQARAWH
jgi:hypothetical protein